jgi:hypothetical protein
MTCGILGLYRERRFSPGKIEADAAVMDAALEALANQGAAVAAMDADALQPSDPRPSVVLTMAQSERALRILAAWEASGTRILNSVGAVRNCYRKPLIARLQAAGMPLPNGRVVPVAEAGDLLAGGDHGRLWIKRGDVHAMQPGDVVSVASPREAGVALGHFRRNGVTEVLVQAHASGPVVKFYGIGPGAFFRAYASDGSDVSASVTALRSLAAAAAAAVGLDVYGGDAVLPPDREPVLIDLNDWPSFSRCTRAAGIGIAAHVRAALNCARPEFPDRSGPPADHGKEPGSP